MGSSTSFSAAWTTRSATTGTVASYCDPFHVVCGLGFHFGGKLVAVGDSLFTAGLQVGREVDPSASALAASGGQVAALGPVVDGIGFDAEPACYFCDGQFAVLAVDVVAVAVHVRAGRQAVAAGGFGVCVEGDAPAAGGAAAGGQGAGGQPGVHGGHADLEPFGDSTRRELAGDQQIWGTDLVGVAQVAGAGGVERFAGAGGVPGGIERGGEFGVGQRGADLTGQGDGRRCGPPPLGDRPHPLHDDFLGGAGVPPQPDA